jgi:mono/diheme cytochrome c family protein
MIIRLLSVLLFTIGAGAADEPILKIWNGSQKAEFKRSELLKNPKIQKITIDDPNYGKKMTYVALPMPVLFESIKIPEQATIQFKCTDGFSAVLGISRLLGTANDVSKAYLAIETPNSKWPRLKNSKSTPAPFYLVWENPEKSAISVEEWPFMLEGFEVKTSIAATYPNILPNAGLSAESSVQKGFSEFLRNCFVCHMINGNGGSSIGPDLNYPLNPTEYLGAKYIKTLVRNPQELRRWKNSRMPSFSEARLGEKELDNIIEYLKHMSGRKAVPAQ